MSDVTLVSRQVLGPIGPYVATMYTFLGDTSGTTYTTNLKNAGVVACIVGNTTNTTATSASIAATTGVLTFSAAPAAGNVEVIILHKP